MVAGDAMPRHYSSSNLGLTALTRRREEEKDRSGGGTDVIYIFLSVEIERNPKLTSFYFLLILMGEEGRRVIL